MQNINEDIRLEGGRIPITIDLQNLDSQQMLLYLASIEGNTPRYQLARNNCSHVVAKALKEGANRKPSFVPHAGNYSRFGKVLGIGIWTPDQILRFARELQ